MATKYASTSELVDKLHRFCDDTTLFIATQNTRPIGTESPVAILLEDKTPALRGWCKVIAAWADATSPFKRPGVQLELSRLSGDSQRVFDEMRAARAEAARTDRRPRTEKYPLSRQQRPPTLQVPHVSATAPGDTGRVAVLREAFTAELPIFTNMRPAAVIREELDPPTDRMSEDEIAVIRSVTGAAPVVVERARPPRGTPTETPITALVPAPAPEPARAPHSQFILPANPLSELTDDSLRGFVDCRLYEETALAMHDEVAPPPPPVPHPRPQLTTDEVPTLTPAPAPIAMPYLPPPMISQPLPLSPVLPPFISQPLNAPSFRPAPTLQLDALPRVRWDVVVATVTIALALVFAAATLVRGRSAPPPPPAAARP